MSQKSINFRVLTFELISKRWLDQRELMNLWTYLYDTPTYILYYDIKKISFVHNIRYLSEEKKHVWEINPRVLDNT